MFDVKEPEVTKVFEVRYSIGGKTYMTHTKASDASEAEAATRKQVRESRVGPVGRISIIQVRDYSKRT